MLLDALKASTRLQFVKHRPATHNQFLINIRHTIESFHQIWNLYIKNNKGLLANEFTDFFSVNLDTKPMIKHLTKETNLWR